MNALRFKSIQQTTYEYANGFAVRIIFINNLHSQVQHTIRKKLKSKN